MFTTALHQIRRVAKQMPYGVGRVVAQIPFGFRPGFGASYTRMQSDIEKSAVWDEEAAKTYVLTKIRKLVAHAEASVPFYRELYKQRGVKAADLRRFEDLASLPIVTKQELQSVPLKHRSSVGNATGYLANTGGTSGEPLQFYLPHGAMCKEWAHLHDAFRSVQFCHKDLRLGFNGRSNVSKYVEYDGARHLFAVDAYASPRRICDRLRQIVKKAQFTHLHGYPSAIAEFARACVREAPDLLEKLRRTLTGIILSSEYPDEHDRALVEDVFQCHSVSFYGHSERVILATERRTPYLYESYLTYGYAEAVDDDDNNASRLVGTSYDNYVTPFIRYDTGDGIVVVDHKNGLLKRFMVCRGRKGEYVLDSYGNNITLTALIFGRHHALFELVRYIQVRQYKAGELQLLLVPRDPTCMVSPRDALQLFDSTNLSMTIEVQFVENPIRAKSGKIPLLIREDRISE